MFITRQPFHQKRNYKFSNQLAGKTYNNHKFLDSCSYLETEIKLSTTFSEDNQQMRGKSHKRFSVQSFVESNVKADRNKQVYSAAPRSNYLENDYGKSACIRKTFTETRKSIKLVNTAKPNLSIGRSSLMNTVYRKISNQEGKSKPRRTLKRKLAFNPSIDPFYSPLICIRVIDKLVSYKDISQKQISINFEGIYKKLIKPQLQGKFTANFMQTLEHYIRQIIRNDQMYINPWGIELETALKSISKKDELLDVINEMETTGDVFKIHELVKFYSVAPLQASQSILKELIEDLVIEIFEAKSCNRDIEYCILAVTGQQITHINQIYFSTTQLLLSPVHSTTKSYENYKCILEEHEKSMRMSFKESIKHNFVEKVVSNKIEDGLVNYQERPEQYSQYRKQIVEQAESLIMSKSKIRIKSKREILNRQPDGLNSSTGHSRRDDLFANYIVRKKQERRQYEEIITKLNQILDPNHRFEVKSQLDQSTEEQFRRLRLFNDKYDITFNYHNNSSILLVNMLQNCNVFNTKTPEQLVRLGDMLEQVYGRGIGQIQFWQFKEIYETAYGVADQTVISKLVLSYFAFDDFGEISKERFFHTIDICVARVGRTADIIKNVIWKYLEMMRLIQNNALRKRNIQIWYEPVKIIYLLFLSIIFGSEYRSIQEMVEDLIKYQYF